MQEQKKLSLAKNAAYNTIGSIIYCFCQWAVTMVVTRVSNYENVGILQLSISITNIFYAFAIYSLRTYQISDITNEYSSGEYVAVRFLTCAASLIMCAVYVCAFGYDAKKIFCILAYMLFKLNEALSDIYHGIDQKNYRMDYVGISYILRGIASLLIFVLALYFTDDIFISIVLMAAVSLLIVAVYDVKNAARFDSVKPVFKMNKIAQILIKCLPAVISSAAFVAITTLPRQYLENIHGESIIGFYSNVATPVVIVQLLVTSIFNPLITDLSIYYNNKNSKKFLGIVFKTVGFILVFAVVAFAAAGLFGKFALVLIYGESIAPYSNLLFPCIACSIIYTICSLCTNLLIIMRKLKSLMVITLLSLLAAVLSGRAFIGAFYMNGVSYCVISSYLIYIAACAMLIIKDFKSKKV